MGSRKNLDSPLTLEDLNDRNYPTDHAIEMNLLTTYQRLKVVEALYIAAGGHPFHVTSGLRSNAKQAELIKAGKTTATKSHHLTGRAADIYDANGSLKKWLRENPEVLVNAELWCEHYDYTATWCHFQTVPPRSGNRWFVP